MSAGNARTTARSSVRNSHSKAAHAATDSPREPTADQRHPRTSGRRRPGSACPRGPRGARSGPTPPNPCLRSKSDAWGRTVQMGQTGLQKGNVKLSALITANETPHQSGEKAVGAGTFGPAHTELREDIVLAGLAVPLPLDQGIAAAPLSRIERRVPRSAVQLIQLKAHNMPVRSTGRDATNNLLQRPTFRFGRTTTPTAALRHGAGGEHLLRQRVSAVDEQPRRRTRI